MNMNARTLGRRLASTVATATLETNGNNAESAYARAKPFHQIPSPPALPLIGNWMDYRFGPRPLDRLPDTIIDRYRKYGPLVRECILGETFLRVFDPVDVQTIFQSETKTPFIRPLQDAVKEYRKMRNTSLGLGNLNGEEWYRLRSAVQQAMMRPQAVISYLPLVEDVATDFIKYIRQHRSQDDMQVPNFKMVVSKWSLESSGMLVFEKRLGSLSGGDSEMWAEKLINANSKMFELTGILKYSLPLHKWLPTPKWKRLVKVEDHVYRESRRLVQETIDKVLNRTAQTDGSKFNFMAYLLSRLELTREDVFILSLSLFGDGLNTTAPMLIYNIYNLATNPDCQERVYKEVCDHAPHNGRIDSAVLNKMTYLKACVKETFRMFSIGTELSRVTQKNLVLSGYQVPAGTPCDINMGLLLTTDVYFTKPKCFIPERWLRDEKESVAGGKTIHPYLMLPFGHGPRMCAGRRFSEQDLYVILSRLVQNFKISYEYGQIGQYYKTLLLPDGSAQFTFEDRV